jgi:phytoene dehydrogenase-like protein
MYDRRYFEPEYAAVLGKIKPSAGIKICLAAEEPLVGHPGVLFTPFTQRVNGVNEVTQIDPSLAPEGMHLTMSHQTMLTKMSSRKVGPAGHGKMFAGKNTPYLWSSLP